jgi:hypothetical protein
MALASVEDEPQRFRLLERSANEHWTREQAREQVLASKRLSAPAQNHSVAHGKNAIGRSVDVGKFVFTLYPIGLLIIQQRDKRADDGIVLDRTDFTDEAKALVQDFLDSGAR